MKTPTLAAPALVKAWQRLSPADRRRVPLVLAIAFLTAALLMHALVTLPAHGKAAQDLTRARGRAQQMKSAPKAAPPRWTGRSPAVLAKEVAGLQAELDRQRARSAELQPHFAPLDDLDANRRLQEALARLADDSGLDIELLETRGLNKEERSVAPTAQRLAQLAKANPYQRPLVRLQARASYRALMRFLAGLQDLPYVASPVWLSLQAQIDPPASGRARLQWLQVTMDLTL
jgi:hypothetical protein